MYIPNKLKLNQFRIVQIPSAKEIITRFGMCVGSNYSGDDMAPVTQSKLDLTLQLDAENGNRLAREYAENES